MLVSMGKFDVSLDLAAACILLFVISLFQIILLMQSVIRYFYLSTRYVQTYPFYLPSGELQCNFPPKGLIIDFKYKIHVMNAVITKNLPPRHRM